MYIYSFILCCFPIAEVHQSFHLTFEMIRMFYIWPRGLTAARNGANCNQSQEDAFCLLLP